MMVMPSGPAELGAVPEAACHDHVDKIRRAPPSSISFLLNRQEIGSTRPEYAAKNILAPQIAREL